jgi:hypothetical protein
MPFRLICLVKEGTQIKANIHQIELLVKATNLVKGTSAFKKDDVWRVPEAPIALGSPLS